MSDSAIEECTKCGAAITGILHLVKREIVCKQCHDLLQPQCPYCGAYSKRSKIPDRRSSFRCKACSEQIFVEPNQWLYGTPYLTEEQADYLGFLEQLDRWIFTLGSRDDYEKMRAALRKKFGGEPGIRDVLWGLMNESLSVLGEQHNAGIEELRQTFDGEIPHYMLKGAGAKYEIEEVRELMKNFRAFEREAKAARKERKRRANT